MQENLKIKFTIYKKTLTILKNNSLLFKKITI